MLLQKNTKKWKLIDEPLSLAWRQHHLLCGYLQVTFITFCTMSSFLSVGSLSYSCAFLGSKISNLSEYVVVFAKIVELSPGCDIVSRRRPLPREKGSGDISIANLFCWNADMSMRAQKLRSSRGNCTLYLIARISFAASTLTKREYLWYCGNFYCKF